MVIKLLVYPVAKFQVLCDLVFVRKNLKMSHSTGAKKFSQTRLKHIKRPCLIDCGPRWPGGHGKEKIEHTHTNSNHMFFIPAQA